MIKTPQLLAVIVLVLAVRYMPWTLLPVPVAALYTWIHWARIEEFLMRHSLTAWSYAAAKRAWVAVCAAADRRIEVHVETWVANHRRAPVAVVFCEPMIASITMNNLQVSRRNQRYPQKKTS